MPDMLEDLCFVFVPIRAQTDTRGTHQLSDLWEVPQPPFQFATAYGEPAPNTEGPDGRYPRLSPMMDREFRYMVVHLRNILRFSQ